MLRALKTNARASVTELSALLGMSRVTVRTRLARLVETGVIRRFTVETDLAERETVQAVMTVELQGSASRAVLKTLKQMPGIDELYFTNGAWDLVAMIRVDSLQSFDRLLRAVREIPGVINSETSLLLDRA